MRPRRLRARSGQALLAVAFMTVAVGGTVTVLVLRPFAPDVRAGDLRDDADGAAFALQAPDVALSEIVVGTIGLSLIVIAALRKIGKQEHARQDDDGGER